MIRSPRGWAAGLALGFVLVLVYVTLASAPAGPEEGAGVVEQLCRSAVSERVAQPRFPFAAQVVDLGEGAYRLHGVVDAVQASEAVRRNYECEVRRTGPGEYRVSSLRLWQSH